MRDFGGLKQRIDDAFCGVTVHLGIGSEGEAVAEHGRCHGFHVVGDHKSATGEQRSGLGTAQQCDGGTRRSAQIEQR